MRTKLYSVAAALAVGAITAQAQVYSVNIVGYVNDTHANGQFTLIQNPLNSGTNGNLNSILPNPPAGSSVFVWNGSGYTSSSVTKAGAWNPDQTPLTGTGFFFKPGANYTNTYVGEVGAAPGDSVTNSFTSGIIDLTGSLLPYATTNFSTDTNFGLATPPANSSLFKWTGAGYQSFSVSKAGAWIPTGGAVEVGEAIWLKAGANYNWVQTLPAN